MMLKKYFQVAILLAICTGLSPSLFSQQQKPKNIILLIGDGMGLSEISAGLYYKEGPSNFLRFNTVGLSMTASSKELITDSAAGATAFASGVKTYNGAIGVDKNKKTVETIVEQISKKNIATGVVATSSVVHATPAAFYAHQISRRMYDEIALDLTNSDIDFFAGGGLQYFENRADSIDVLAKLKEKGFDVHTEMLPKKLSDKKQAILLADNGMPKMSENRGDFLPNATKLALNQLSKNNDGFFLMVEGSQIDWGGHANDAEYLISELLDFDNTIGVALDFAKKNGETLVIVTADHETGGFSLTATDGDYNKVTPAFTTGGHTPTMVPVFAKGPGENLLNGIYQNTKIYTVLKTLFKAN